VNTMMVTELEPPILSTTISTVLSGSFKTAS
jgi:hypothetical protein